MSSDDDGEFYRGYIASVCGQLCIKQEFTTAWGPELNDVAERSLCLIDKSRTCSKDPGAGYLLVRSTFTNGAALGVEAMHWACDALVHTVAVANPLWKSTYTIWYWTSTPPSTHSSVSWTRAKSLKLSIEFLPPGRELLLRRAGHRPPARLSACAHTGEQNGGGEGGHVGNADTAGGTTAVNP